MILPATRLQKMRGVTMIEVLVAALLIFMALGGIVAMNARSIHILRSTRQAVASSEMLQERIESIRSATWSQIANSETLAALLARATPSESELADNSFTELITVAVPNATGEDVVTGPACRIERQGQQVRVVEAADLSAEPMLLVDASVQWRAQQGAQQRELRTIVCRSGLTRSGIFGSVLGRPNTLISR